MKRVGTTLQRLLDRAQFDLETECGMLRPSRGATVADQIRRDTAIARLQGGLGVAPQSTAARRAMQQNHGFAIGADVRRSDVGIHANWRFAAHMPRLPRSRDHDVAFAALRVAAGRRVSSGRLPGTDAMGHARILFDAHAIVGALARGEERLPGNPRGIVDPRLFGLGIATGRLSLLDDRAAGLAQARIDIAQLVLAFDLDAEMIEARLLAAGRDREIHARIVEHPFCIVRLDHAGLRGEERRIEADRILEVFYQPAETLTHARMLRVRARLPYPIGLPDVFAMAVSVVVRAA